MAAPDPSELAMYRDSIARLLAGWSREGCPRTGSDQIKLWSELCASGWGAVGANADDVPLLAIALKEMGSAGLPVPIIGAAAINLLLGGKQDAADFVAAVGNGAIRVSLSLGPFDGDPNSGRANISDDRVTGTLAYVEDTDIATHLLVINGERSVSLVPLASDGATITPCPGLATPPLAQISLHEAQACSLPIETGQARRLADLTRLMLIARALGAGQREFALALDYAGIRRQFGQLIGTFQAIRHKLADCRVRLDLVEVLLDDAVTSFVQHGDTERAVASLVSVAGPALRRTAVEMQHVFGAVAFADEHEVARHFTRIHADTSRMGGTRHARKVLASRLLQADNENAVFPLASEPENIRNLRQQVRSWLAEHWGPDIQKDPARGKDADFPFNHALADKGWLTASWPVPHGGPGFDAFEQFAFLEEMRIGNAPMTLISPSYWVVAPSIIAAGTLELQAQLLPEMARGRMSFALGYSEPQAGSDLAALATRAVRQGDDYIISGQKIWTSNTEYASHIFLAARTGGDPVTDKHNGITVFVVPIDAPGITIQRMNTLMNKSYAVMFLDEVRVPSAMMVGGEGDGWTVLSAALGAERIIMGGQIASLRGFFARLVMDLRQDPETVNDSVLWERLGELAAELDAARALSKRSVRLVSQGNPATVEGAIAKLFSGELAERLGEAVLDLCGARAGYSAGAVDVLLGGLASQNLRTAIMLSIGGGTAEIQRNVIAQRGLKLPR